MLGATSDPLRRDHAAEGRFRHRVMERRSFLGALASGLLAVPLAVEAQQAGKVPRVGYLSPGSSSDPVRLRRFEAFRQGLRELGYVDVLALDIAQLAQPLAEGLGPVRLRRFEAFRQGLRELGYVEGQNIVLEPRWG